MIQVASKYERRVDTRSYGDKKKLFEGVSFPLRAAFLTNIIIIITKGYSLHCSTMLWIALFHFDNTLDWNKTANEPTAIIFKLVWSQFNQSLLNSKPLKL